MQRKQVIESLRTRRRNGRKKKQSSFRLSMMCSKCYRVLIGCLVAAWSCCNCTLCSFLVFFFLLLLRMVPLSQFSHSSQYVVHHYERQKKTQRTQNIDEVCWLECISLMCESFHSDRFSFVPFWSLSQSSCTSLALSFLLSLSPLLSLTLFLYLFFGSDFFAIAMDAYEISCSSQNIKCTSTCIQNK